MPVEIKELQIKAVINESGSQSGQAGSIGSSKNTEVGNMSEKEDIVAECIEKVLAILKEKNER